MSPRPRLRYVGMEARSIIYLPDAPSWRAGTARRPSFSSAVVLVLSDAARAAPSRRGRSSGWWRARATVLLARRTSRKGCAQAKSSIDSYPRENRPRRRRRAICLEEHPTAPERRSGAAIVLAVRLSERCLSAWRLSAWRRLSVWRRLEQQRRACQRRGRMVREGGAQRAARGHRRGRAL